MSAGIADGSVFIGTDKNNIVEGSVQKNKFVVVVWGHSGQVRGLATHPDDLCFISVGYGDKTVALWRKHKVKRLLKR